MPEHPNLDQLLEALVAYRRARNYWQILAERNRFAQLDLQLFIPGEHSLATT